MSQTPKFLKVCDMVGSRKVSFIQFTIWQLDDVTSPSTLEYSKRRNLKMITS